MLFNDTISTVQEHTASIFRAKLRSVAKWKYYITRIKFFKLCNSAVKMKEVCSSETLVEYLSTSSHGVTIKKINNDITHIWWSSGLLTCVVIWPYENVSGKHTASIFKAEERSVWKWNVKNAGHIPNTLHFSPEDGGNKFLRNDGLQPKYFHRKQH
jgi:hypothetical protein